jgi:hypothetical protein
MKIKLTKTQYENLLNEMRFDGKSTGLFADEEPKEDRETGEDYTEEDIVNISIHTIDNQIVVLATLGNEKVGALRLKPYKDSYQVDSVMVKPEYRRMGIGTEMYREANEKHYPLYSDQNQTIGSQSLWNKLIRSGEAKEEDGRYVMLPPQIGEGKKKKRGRPKAERSKSGRSVPGKYLTKNKSAMKKEIDKYAGKDTYKTKWDADYKSGKGGVGKRYETKKSAATKAYERMYGSKNESVDLEEAKKGKSSTDDTLAKKAKASGISKTILKQVHSRGMAAWNSGHRPGTPQNAWAMGRVNSFITGSGGARKADADLWKKAKKSKARKKKSKKNESVNINRMVITENRTIISEGLRYHLDNQIPLVENVYRYGSESYFNLINEVRSLYNEGKVDLSFMDEELIKTDIGKKAIFEGKEVWLDIPIEDNEILTEVKFRGKDVDTSSPQRDSSGGKAYKVYVSGCAKKTKSNPSGVKQIRFGSGGLRAKLSDPDRRKAYDSRHGCSKGRHNDKCKAGYWSCRLPRYSEKLNLSGGGTWW